MQIEQNRKAIGRIKICAFTFLSLLSLVTLNLNAQSNSKKGLIDLNDHNFNDKPTVALNGEWEFYWNKLLLSSDIETYTPVFGDFISIWGDQNSSFGFATYRILIQLPKDNPNLTLQIPDFYSSYELFANGTLIANNGSVGTSKDKYTPKWIPQNVPLVTTDTTTLELILHVANFHHSRGGAYKPILIGKYEDLAKNREAELAYSYILTGIILMIGFFFFGLYYFGKKEKEILFFSIFCFVYSYRIIGFGIYPLNFLFPEVPWLLTLKLEYITLFLSPLFFGLYTLNLYPKETSKLLVNILSSISLLFVVSVIFLPTYWFTRLVTPNFIILISYIFYAFWVYTKASINKRDGAQFALASTGVVFFVFLYQIMVYLGIFKESITFNFLGYMFFFSLQSLVLTYRFSTSLKRAREKAEAASRAKSQFLSTMSHEIRTPLNAVIGLSELLAETPLNVTQENYVKTIKISGENLLSIINNILDYSKIESSRINLQQSEIAIQELIENVLDLVAPLNVNTSVELIYDIDDSVSPFVITDQVKLQQILINLINNAVKFTEEGEIFVQLKMETYPNSSKAKLYISVSDTGVGIPHEGLEKLFKSFSQVDSSTSRQYGGTGLGLVISKRLIEAFGGSIEVKSEYGKGTEFTFFVDVTKTDKVNPPYISNILNGKKALIIDDNVTNLKIFEQQGLHHGLEIVTNTDPYFVTKNLSTLDEFDFIVLDMQMPKKDGIDVAKEIRSKWPKETLPLVMLSSIHGIENKGDLELFNLHLTKPVKQSQLFKSLESLFSFSEVSKKGPFNSKDLLLKSSKAKILVVEDNLFNQKVAQKILERFGFKPSVAENGQIAFDEVMNNNYDLVFMDIQMPVMDGIEATKNLRASEHKLTKRPIIVAMTANALAEDKERCLNAGMDDFITKPITIDSIKKVLEKWL